MATRITIRVPIHPGDEPGDRKRREVAAQRALRVFGAVERECTRFDPESPLMRANRSPSRWQRLPELLFAALSEAARAHRLTDGRFDPRVLRDLVALGYDRTLPFGDGTVQLVHREGDPLQPHITAWEPRFRPRRREAMLGGDPVDLGGIGKGLAVQWASRSLARDVENYLIDAGGDCYCAGLAADGETWHVGVEDPAGGDQPLAVLAVSDLAVTTSSKRLRRWSVGGREVHHLIDPATGLPGGSGLLSVTVVGEHPSLAEVWSKTLLLEGASDIAALARRRDLAALWVCDDGQLQVSDAMRRHLIWRRA